MQSSLPVACFRRNAGCQFQNFVCSPHSGSLLMIQYMYHRSSCHGTVVFQSSQNLVILVLVVLFQGNLNLAPGFEEVFISYCQFNLIMEL